MEEVKSREKIPTKPESPETFVTNFERGESITINHELLGDINAVVIYQETTPAGNQCVWFEMPSGKIDFVFPGSTPITKKKEGIGEQKPTTLPGATKLAETMFDSETSFHVVLQEKNRELSALIRALKTAGIIHRPAILELGTDYNDSIERQQDYPKVIFSKTLPTNEKGEQVSVLLDTRGGETTIYPPTKNTDGLETYNGNHTTQLIQLLLQSGLLDSNTPPALQGLQEKLPQLLQIARLSLLFSKLVEHRIRLIPQEALNILAKQEESGFLKNLKESWEKPLESWLLNAQKMPNTLYQMAADPKFCRNFLGLSTEETLPDFSEDWLRDNQIPKQETQKKNTLKKTNPFLSLFQKQATLTSDPFVKQELGSIAQTTRNRQRQIPISLYTYIHQTEALGQHPGLGEAIIESTHPLLQNTAIFIPGNLQAKIQDPDKRKILLQYFPSVMEDLIGTPSFPIHSQIQFYSKPSSDNSNQSYSGFSLLSPVITNKQNQPAPTKKLLDYLTKNQSSWAGPFSTLQQSGKLFTSGDHYIGCNASTLDQQGAELVHPRNLLEILGMVNPKTFPEGQQRNIYEKYKLPNLFGYGDTEQ